jgi:hypothetical protein
MRALVPRKAPQLRTVVTMGQLSTPAIVPYKRRTRLFDILFFLFTMDHPSQMFII